MALRWVEVDTVSTILSIRSPVRTVANSRLTTPVHELRDARQVKSEYAAATAILLADEFGQDRLWSEVIDNRDFVAKALHLGIEPDEHAAWVDTRHRTIPAEVEAADGHVLVWRYCEWDSWEHWESGADSHTAMYSTNWADIISITGFGARHVRGDRGPPRLVRAHVRPGQRTDRPPTLADGHAHDWPSGPALHGWPLGQTCKTGLVGRHRRAALTRRNGTSVSKSAA